jgi:hypothetical protein
MLALISSAADTKGEKTYEPAFRWAQNHMEVFLDLKFAEKFEQKSCVNITGEEYTLSEDMGSLLIEARCVEDNKLYKLNLPLYDTVRPLLRSEEELEVVNAAIAEHNKLVKKRNQPRDAEEEIETKEDYIAAAKRKREERAAAAAEAKAKAKVDDTRTDEEKEADEQKERMLAVKEIGEV